VGIGDDQGKSEQMMDYIKKLRACIRAFQELDTTHNCEKEELMKQLKDEKRSHAETGDHHHHLLLFQNPICQFCEEWAYCRVHHCFFAKPWAESLH
jgi:hypothetical protein